MWSLANIAHTIGAAGGNASLPEHGEIVSAAGQGPALWRATQHPASRGGMRTRSFSLDAAEMRNEADELVNMRLLGHRDESGKGVYWLTEFGRAAVAMEGILRLSSAA